MADAVVRPDALKLDTDESTPPGMVRVPGWLGPDFGSGPTRGADSFRAWHEVTNRGYKSFVAAGGYERHDFLGAHTSGGQAMGSWREAMTLSTIKYWPAPPEHVGGGALIPTGKRTIPERSQLGRGGCLCTFGRLGASHRAPLAARVFAGASVMAVKRQQHGAR